MPTPVLRLLTLGLAAGLVAGPCAPATATGATATDTRAAAAPEYTDRTTVAGWGGFDSGQSSRPRSLATTDLVAISAGDDNSIALSRSGRVTAWGDDFYGQSSPPAALTDGTTRVVAVDAGEHHSLALTAAGDVVAWGGGRETDEGQLDVPAGLGPVTHVAAGRYHSLAVLTDGSVEAWGAVGRYGDVDEGQLDVPAVLEPGGTEQAVDVAAGARHSLAATASGQVLGWGSNVRGQVLPPEEIRGADAGVVDVEAYGFASLALTDDGRVHGWGDDGTGTVSVPAWLAEHRIVDISLGSEIAMALSDTGRVFTWGDTAEPVPGTVARHAPFVGIAAGGRHELVLHRLPRTASRVTVSAPATQRQGRPVTVTVRLTGATSGSATLLDGSRRVATVALRADGAGAAGRAVLRGLSVGTHRLRARYAGTDLVASSTSAVESVRITKR
ncbi:Ig-like domain repeat protein [Nocardioides sp. CFH 31398]|uniref:Ig-like domain repeat protein n=1 Tax=Nocardioides sp. CFH 31398 TaxID=2919579 RepID=UPI001F059617|nr:Ig-like domain repeat protein [Nocardioides sp. CFH 31398]MCH1864939.1 Ig-like domain repeat protein [Nocardioides sp. CFH 31398]